MSVGALDLDPRQLRDAQRVGGAARLEERVHQREHGPLGDERRSRVDRVVDAVHDDVRRRLPLRSTSFTSPEPVPDACV
jgi:hypothetical protein